ncbi:AbrB/MazE/SpoVT family DNA-binding domain-containing protein [Streptomyces griseoincarnatus]
MTILTLRPKNQVTVPKDIAEAAGLHVGDALDFTVVDGAVVISKVDGQRTLAPRSRTGSPRPTTSASVTESS